MNTQEKIDNIETLKLVLSSEGFNLQNESEWETLMEHIEVHKYFVNQNIGWTISWDDALFSWYENVFSPIKQILSHRQVRNAFPGKTLGELFFDISSHWYYMQEKNSPICYIDAANDYISKYGKGISKFFALVSLQPAA